MARLFLSSVLLSTLSSILLGAIPPQLLYVSNTCPFDATPGGAGLARIPMGDFGVSPWVKPHENMAAGCLSWDGLVSQGMSNRERRRHSVCDKILVPETSRYAIGITTDEAHRHIKGTKYEGFWAKWPEAVIIIKKNGRTLQWVNYHGHPFLTKELERGRLYEICIHGRSTSFTMCMLDVIACDKPDAGECGFHTKGPDAPQTARSDRTVTGRMPKC